MYFSDITLTKGTIFLFCYRRQLKKMDFILNEAIEEDDEFKLVFSDDSEEEFSAEQELNFIDDDEGEEQEEASFYRSVDHNECVKFSNQTRVRR